jgi:hypothetical protein
MTAPPSNPDDPYCSHCGYVLKGLTDSSKCPECGRPLVEVLTRPNWAPRNGKRYRSKATLFGLPVIDIAIGPANGELRGKARGIIAIGDIASGGIAIGGLACGIVAVGGLAVGLFSIGGLALGLLTAIGGLAIGALAAGGGAVGLLANGGGAAGLYAQGGGALGLHVRDGRWTGATPALNPFARWAWFFGTWPPRGISIYQPMLINLGITLGAAAIIGMAAWIALQRGFRYRDAGQG